MPRIRTLERLSSQNIGSDYTDEEREFLVAIDRYKRWRQRPFLTWREVLQIVHSLGYRRVAEPGPLPVPGEQP